MGKQLILEYAPVTCRVLEERIDKNGEPTLRVLVKWQQADKVNANKRLYRRPLLEREIGRLSPMMKNGEVWGSSYHPEDGVGRVQDISHQWEKAWIDEKTGECFGELSVLPTSQGKDLMVVLKKGKIGMSSRGKGTLTHKTGVVEGREQEFDEVNDDYFMLTPGDFVLGPSVDDAGVVKILESKINENVGEEGEDELEKELQETEDELDLDEEFTSLRSALEDAVRAGFDPDSWVKDFSATEVVVQRTERDLVTGATADVLLRMPYSIDDKTDEITVDFSSAEAVKSAVDYVPEELDEARFGKLSEMEMRISGAKAQFGRPKRVELSTEEARYISPRLAQILRDEKFPKK
jgi:hypothetical protein